LGVCVLKEFPAASRRLTIVVGAGAPTTTDAAHCPGDVALSLRVEDVARLVCPSDYHERPPQG
jgi:hypothetical protein